MSARLQDTDIQGEADNLYHLSFSLPKDLSSEKGKAIAECCNWKGCRKDGVDGGLGKKRGGGKIEKK